MVETQAIHECLFCSQTFGTAAAKDDHVLEHFAQETCVECNRDLIRIGGSLYVKHDATICSIKVPKYEKTIEPVSTVSAATARDNDSQCVSIKIERNTLSDDSSESVDLDVFDKHDDSPTNPTAFEDANQSINSGIESKWQETFCKEESVIESTDAENICGRLFSVTEDRDAHRRECALKSKFTCEICSMVFAHKRSLRRHILRVHESILCKTPESRSHSGSDNINQNQFTCKICSKGFGYKQSLQRHLSGVHKSIFCKICYELFPVVDDRDKHQLQCNLQRKMSKHKMEHKRFECDICGHATRKKSNFVNHMLGKHCPETNRRFVCKICGKNLKFKGSLQKHHIRKHMMENTFDCDDIDDVPIGNPHEQDVIVTQDTTENPSRISKELILDSPIGTFYCGPCLKIFSSADELNAHRAQCTKEVLKFECDICHKVISTKGDLRKHMIARHDPNGDKLKCKTCSSVFMHESSLAKHQCKGRTANPLSQRDLIPCETCGRIITRGAMRSHRVGFHSAPGTIYCRSCYKVFSNADDLNTHTQKCSGRMKWKMKSPCPICGKILANPRALSKHTVSLHSAPGTIFCRTCVKKFKTAEELTAHKPECTLKRKFQKQNKLAQNNGEEQAYTDVI